MSGWGLFVWGCVGAGLAEAVNLRALFSSNKRKWRFESRRVAFWIFAIIFVLAGGATALAHESADTTLSRWLALNVGFTWPLLLRRGASAAPEVSYDAD